MTTCQKTSCQKLVVKRSVGKRPLVKRLGVKKPVVERPACLRFVLCFQAPKAASVPSSRSRNQSSASVPPHPGFHNPRKLSLSDTFTVKSFEDTKYPILPPLTKPIEASDVDSGVKEALKGVNERSLEAMLREMRKLDRDRDGVLPPANIHKFMDKFQVRIQGLILDHLYQRFVDNRFPDMINYEALMKYLLKMKTSIGKFFNHQKCFVLATFVDFCKSKREVVCFV